MEPPVDDGRALGAMDPVSGADRRSTVLVGSRGAVDLGDVTVIATVLDEASNIETLLESLALQTRPPDQVVIVDGGSTDGTYEALLRRVEEGRLPLLVLQRPGVNISRGRNEAIGAARGPIIACTDAGVRLNTTWLESLCAPLIAARVRVASGFFRAAPLGPFETALGATTLPQAREIDEASFLPSSRSVAFLKEDWHRVGGYPEWLDYCEDLVFDIRLLAAAGPAEFVPAAAVAFKPRTSVQAYFKQYFRYARGDGKADLWRKRHAVRYLTYGIVGPLLVWLTWREDMRWAIALFGACAVYLRRPYMRLVRLWDGLTAGQRLCASLWVPVLRLVGDVAKMLGYPAGWAWRVRNRPPSWRP